MTPLPPLPEMMLEPLVRAALTEDLGTCGDITTRTNGLNTTKKRNESAMDDMETRLEQRQANLLKQYQALDAKMATMSSLSSFITSQVSQWNKS